jgi:non-heme chloroperoxidase
MRGCRHNFAWLPVALFVSFWTPLLAQSATCVDPSPHRTQFVSVEKGVKLEVLDWGGSGKPIVLLAGGGDTAHTFDDFAPKLTAHDHVYAITRRGFGASGYAPSDNVTDRLGEDVLAVMNVLKLKKPVLVGHSIAGAEMSWIANHNPQLVAGLIYLEAGYSYAFDNGKGASVMAMQALQAPQPPAPSKADLASFCALANYYQHINGFRFPVTELRQEREPNPDGTVGEYRQFPGGAMLMSLIKNSPKYMAIPVPALFLFANPHSLGKWVDQNSDPNVQSGARTYSTALMALTKRQEDAVRNGLPATRVITVPYGNHYVYLSNEEVVLRDIRAFVSSLH